MVLNKYRVKILIVILFCGLFGTVPAQAQERARIEDQVKVAMIYNLAKFVNWPVTAFSDQQSSFVICYLGSTSFKDELYPLQEKIIKNRAISVRDITRLEDIGVCHILVVSEDFHDDLAFIEEKARQRGIFTVSEIPGFAERGGMVELLVSEGKVRFKINQRSLQTSQLIISSQVLKLSLDVIN